jgi:hypothetical protein
VYSPTTDVQRRDKSEVVVTEMTIKDEFPLDKTPWRSIPSSILDMSLKELKRVTGGNR